MAFLLCSVRRGQSDYGLNKHHVKDWFSGVPFRRERLASVLQQINETIIHEAWVAFDVFGERVVDEAMDAHKVALPSAKVSSTLSLPLRYSTVSLLAK